MMCCQSLENTPHTNCPPPASVIAKDTTHSGATNG